MPLNDPRTAPLPPFVRGVDHLTQPSFLAPGFVSLAKNIEFERGVAKQRRGFQARTFDDTGVMSAAGGLPLADASAIIGIALMWPASASGAEAEVYFDQNKAYLYNYSNGTVASLFEDSDGPTDIDCFGGSSGQVSWTIAPINRASAVQPTLVFTDGLEYSGEHTIYEFDGSTVWSHATPATALGNGQVVMSDFDDFQYAKQVMWFSDHFMIGDYADDGTRFRNRVAWGEFQQAGIQTGGQDNGEYIISDAEGFLLRLIRLGPHLAIYFSESIIIVDRVPTDDIYAFDVRVHGTGLLAANAVANIGRGLHVLLGTDDVYVYDGGLAPTPIGDAISKHVLESVNPDSLDTIVTQHLPLDNLVKWYVPIEAATQPNAVLSYNYREQTFSSLGKVAKKITAVGVGTRTASARCNDAQFADLTVTGTLSPDITSTLGTFTNIGIQSANGDYDPTEPDATVYQNNTWYLWHDSVGGETWVISEVIGTVGARYWSKVYAAMNTAGAYTAAGTATGEATVAEGNYHRCDDSGFVGVACSDYYKRGGFAVPLLGANDGEVYEVLESTTDDAGVAIVSELEGPSEFIGEAYGDQGSVVEVKVESKGGEFELEYSIDHGTTWTPVGGTWGGFDSFTLERKTVSKVISSFFMLRAFMVNSTTQIKYMSTRRKTQSSRGLG